MTVPFRAPMSLDLTIILTSWQTLRAGAGCRYCMLGLIAHGRSHHSRMDLIRNHILEGQKKTKIKFRLITPYLRCVARGAHSYG